MKAIKALVLVALTLSACSAKPNLDMATENGLYFSYKKHGQFRNATLFLYEPQRFLTCWHVLDGIDHDGYKVLWHNEKKDLALGEFIMDFGFKPLPVRWMKQKNLEVGDTLWGKTNAYGMRNIYTQHIVVGIANHVILVKPIFDLGSSGAALYTEKNVFVGLVRANFCADSACLDVPFGEVIPAWVIEEEMEKHGTPKKKPTPPSAEMQRW